MVSDKSDAEQLLLNCPSPLSPRIWTFVRCQGGEAGEDQQLAGRPELGGGGAVQCEVPGAEQDAVA